MPGEGANTAESGWTERLEVHAPTNGLANGYLVPARDGSPGGGFITSTADQYYYVVEMTPTTIDELDPDELGRGPLMSPVLDDVVILYAPWSAARVVSEREVIGD